MSSVDANNKLAPSKINMQKYTRLYSKTKWHIFISHCISAMHLVLMVLIVYFTRFNHTVRIRRVMVCVKPMSDDR